MNAFLDTLKKYQFFQQLQQFSFVEKIILYGSRARGDHQERSDIDLAIVCPTATPSNWLEVMNVITNADTLLKIDCVQFEALSDQSSLKQAIQTEGITVYEQTPKIQQTYTNLSKALNKLEIMLARPMDEDRANIDASIQRFEFCVELFWKFLKRIMSQLGTETNFPREVIQQAYAGNLIDDEQQWLQMLKDRNETSHTYDEELADRIYGMIKTTYYPLMRKTFNQLSGKFF